MNKLIINAVVAVALLTLSVSGSWAKPQEPLLMPGKKSLFQRMLSVPNAKIHTAPASGDAYELPPFSVLYVYAQKTTGGNKWLAVGTDRHNQPNGWVSANQLIDWKQTLTVVFKDPLGQDRSLLFKDRESLKGLVESRDMYGYNLLYQKASKNEISAESPVVAIQPKAYVDILKDFYLVPIIEHEDMYVGDVQGLMLKVATLPLVEGTNAPEAPVASQASPDNPTVAAEDAYRAGIVFVIDSTISMGPYIDRTRQAVRKVYDAIGKTGLQDKVSFGLVAYRDNVSTVPKLEYLTQTYANLSEGTDSQTFFNRVSNVRPASVSSKGYNEDAYAGVKHAIEGMNWAGYDARYIVLITDAGARPSEDPLGSTGLNADALRQLAYDKGISIWALHLLTPSGAKNHTTAADQYKRLSSYPGVGELYYPVQLGSVSDFGQVLDTFAGQITLQVKEASKGVAPKPVYTEEKQDPIQEFQRKVSTLGYALRMRYLQSEEGAKIPSVVNAWMVDRDIAQPERASVEVRILLTRDQLSDLQAVLKKILETAEEGVLSPKDFLAELKSVAATISRDPSAASASTRTTGSAEQNLADLGYMREYIEDLPYTGEVMNLSLQTWEDWPAQQQLKFVHRIESKINYYQAIHDNSDLWVSLDGGAVTGDSVYPVALDMLP